MPKNNNEAKDGFMAPDINSYGHSFRFLISSIL